MKLEGKVAIVTGGGRGIGEGIVRCLAEEGANVAVVDLDGDNARSVAAAVVSLGRESLAIQADATNSEKVAECVRSTIDCFGRIDILVNNVGGVAGVPTGGLMPTIDTRSDEEWQSGRRFYSWGSGAGRTTTCFSRRVAARAASG